MAVFALRESAWGQANDSQKWALRLAARKTELGQPAVYEQANGTGWFVFSDDRIDLLDVAVLGTVAAGLAQFPNWTVPVDRGGEVLRAAAREQLYDFVKANIVLPKDIQFTEIVQVEAPVYEWVEVPVLDENGDPTGETVTVRRDTGQTQLVDVEQSLGDPYDLTLQAQGAPNWVAARQSIPAGIAPRDTV